MSTQTKPFAAGLDGQGRFTTRQLHAEDASGLCDTCPGELGLPEASFQASADTPNEPMPWRALGFMLAVAFLALLSVHFLVPR